jgi:C4-type Zn-finger protein
MRRGGEVVRRYEKQTHANATDCPHCGSKCRSIRTDQVTPMVREVTYLCTNQLCGFSFVSEVTPVRELQPSRIPRPGVVVPRHDRRQSTGSATA